MFQILFVTHKIVVTIFLLIYLVKTFLFLRNNAEGLLKFNKATKMVERLVSVLFLATGIYLLLQAPELGTLFYIKLIFVFASIPLAVIGFKKSNKALVILSFLLILGAYGLGFLGWGFQGLGFRVQVLGFQCFWGFRVQGFWGLVFLGVKLKRISVFNWNLRRI